MIKLITFLTKIVLIAIAAILFSSCNNICNYKTLHGNGNVTTEKRIVQADFKSIDVSNAIDVEIIQAETLEINVIADDNIQKEITTNVNNGVLEIKCDYNSYKNISSKKVVVKMPVINNLEASSAASISNKNTLKGENISINSSSASSIKLNLEFDAINCDSSSGSSMELSGKTTELNANASSGSRIKADKMIANNVISDVSSGASISVYPMSALKADASSGGNIIYYNLPKTIEKNQSSGGNISQN